MLLYPPPSCWLSGPLSSAPMLLYSGGMPRASYGDRHCLTVQQDKEHVTLDFTSRVIDFFTIHSVEREQGGGGGPTWLVRNMTHPQGYGPGRVKHMCSTDQLLVLCFQRVSCPRNVDVFGGDFEMEVLL